MLSLWKLAAAIGTLAAVAGLTHYLAREAPAGPAVTMAGPIAGAFVLCEGPRGRRRVAHCGCLRGSLVGMSTGGAAGTAGIGAGAVFS
jgi:hypothetical protein